jgi:hypothetical protein
MVLMYVPLSTSTRYAHEHAEVTDSRGRPVFALPGQTFGPELDVHAEFPDGRHRPVVGAVPGGRRRRDHRAVHRAGPLTSETSPCESNVLYTERTSTGIASSVGSLLSVTARMTPESGK